MMIKEGKKIEEEEIHLMIEKETIILKREKEIPGMKRTQLIVNLNIFLFLLFLVVLL